MENAMKNNAANIAASTNQDGRNTMYVPPHIDKPEPVVNDAVRSYIAFLERTTKSLQDIAKEQEAFNLMLKKHYSAPTDQAAGPGNK
ncbi:MAG: hypothetical protein ACOYPR_14215 [Saprospiraceae bacterium]